MKTLVTVKRVIDSDSVLKIDNNNRFINVNDVNMVMNPFDEIAVEEALRIREKHGGEVIIVSIGHGDSIQQIRSALAMGADRGILCITQNDIDGYVLSSILKNVVLSENVDLIIMGKQSVDDDAHQVCEMLSEQLGYDQGIQANKILINDDMKKVRVIKEVDGGLETIELYIPCVISADLRLNEPRYASLPGIMKAKHKPVIIKNIDDLDCDKEVKLKIIKLELPGKKKTGEILSDVKTLVYKLKHECKLI